MAEMKVIPTKNVNDLTKDELVSMLNNQSEIIEKSKETMSNMYNDIRVLQDERVFARLNFLFKILDYKNYFSDKNFIGDDKEKETFVFDCVDEIYNLMKLPKKNE